MKTFGFAGTAKNTGKTTTALAVLEQSRLSGYKNAITSIGFDGESLDHITGLPKPRYQLIPGELIATARECLEASPVRCKVLVETGIDSVLGVILIAEVLETGLVLLAGPNRESDLRLVLKEFAARGAEFTIIDGALNRIVPLICADGLVLATGAAFNQAAQQIAIHAAAVERIFHLPQTAVKAPDSAILIQYADGNTCSLPGGSLINASNVPPLLPFLTEPITDLSIPGACQPDLLADLIPHLPARVKFHLGSPLKMIASGNALRWSQVLDSINEGNFPIDVLQTLPLLLITVNPFFPHYLQKTGSYQPGFIDRSSLLKEMRRTVKFTPVFDILHSKNDTMKEWFHQHISQHGQEQYA
jgi:hypothetical protein